MIATVLTVAFGLGVFSILACVYALVRNEWVYRWQMKAHDYVFNTLTPEEWWARGGPGTEIVIAEYDDMFNRFWVWDVRKFAVNPNEWPKIGGAA